MARRERSQKSNWDVLRSRDVSETSKYRDVFEEQQLDRTAAQREVSRVLYEVIAAAAGIVVASIAWLFIAVLETVAYTMRGGSRGLFAVFAYLAPDLVKIVFTLIVTGVVYGIVRDLLMRQRRAQNLLSDNTDINEHTDDQHIMLPEEMMAQYDWFPDAGAHSSVSPSTLISHVFLDNSGVDKVEFVYPDEDAADDDDTEFYARIDGDRDLLDIRREPMFDHEYACALYKTSGVPEKLRRWYAPNKIPYNPNDANREKLSGYARVSDLVNGDWKLPLYEVQRPAGAYITDGAPVNTMVLAITRAGKGQTYIEPMLDMWTRERRPNNIVANDPKGELLVKNYVPAVVRGYLPVQFNLINALKTDIYNILALASAAAREGNFTQCSMYIENIADVFFPVDGGEDPVWPNAANNAFKRAAYALIDFYMEEERELRNQAMRDGVSMEALETANDQLWGHVTPYNCYQLFVQMTARKRKNPINEIAALQKKAALAASDANAPQLSSEEQARIDSPSWTSEVARAQWESEHLFAGQAEADEMALYFAATEHLPLNGIRNLLSNANNALKSMGAAEKMLASVYGIATTAMSFFADPRIQTLTSGTPSQNVDLQGLSFPRRIGVRFHSDFLARYHIVGLQGVWSAYADDGFTQRMGKAFDHDCLIDRDGWARYAFDGIFPEDVAYLKLELKNASTGLLVRTLYFRFKKTYQKSLDGRTYARDPVLDTKMVKDGVLEELRPSKDGGYAPCSLTFDSKELYVSDGSYTTTDVQRAAIIAHSVHYIEKPKFVFLVTPPHLVKYAKLILILIKQLVDVSFDQSYMTKSNQKPLYKTRYMLDELGNLQSDGHGITSFQTMLSIGLGQDQQFTLILQTLQQLKDVYGDSVDKIIQGNAQPLYARVATPTGFARMSEITVGSAVLTPKHTVAHVTGVYPRGTRRVYRVIMRDGSATYACNEHLWRARLVKKD